MLRDSLCPTSLPPNNEQVPLVFVRIKKLAISILIN